MRSTQKMQPALGDPVIADIKIDLRSRDDIPALLLGLQHIYCDTETRKEVFRLIENNLVQDASHEMRRPGCRSGTSWCWEPYAFA